MRPSFSVASPASIRRARQRLAVLAAGAVTVAGALVVLAAPATAVGTGSAWAATSATVQDCGPYGGSGGVTTCPAPGATQAQATSATVQDCRGPLIGSGGRTCEEPTTTQARTSEEPILPCGPLSTYCPAPDATQDRATSATVQDCRGPFSGSGGRTCEEPTLATVAA